MDEVAKEWNFKDPRTLETLLKRDKKRNGPNRSHQQLPVRRSSSHDYRLQDPTQKSTTKVDSYKHSHAQDESDACLSAKSDPSGAHYSMPRRGRWITPVPAKTLSISPTPPSHSPTFLPSLKPSSHSSNHNITNTKSAASKKSSLPPIAQREKN